VSLIIDALRSEILTINRQDILTYELRTRNLKNFGTVTCHPVKVPHLLPHLFVSHKIEKLVSE